ncbi:hypothetical protein SAMN05421640_2480 [Ekhidna lutea]|uniref:Fimbrial assembly protein (PilN) n=1 Tax=Ekhidna lutea TaxID=447679 RepID=A0A239K7W5_EKHLU|nr:hypothetical protein [Ekhidna lutea]SNT14091.1 hypothetical protein SAMN05421640_2480 [Ekhidna lutea]
MRSLINQIATRFSDRESLGVFIRLKDGHIGNIDYVTLKSHKNLLDITDSYQNVDVKAVEFRRQPIYLSIDGDGVIHKLVENPNDSSPEELVKSNLPKIDLNSVYFQYNPISKDQGYLSIIRRTVFKEVMDHFDSFDSFIINVTLGPFATNILFTIQPEITSVSGSGYQLVAENSLLTSFNYTGVSSDESINFGEQNLNPEILLPYFSAIQHFIPSQNNNSAEWVEIEEQRKEFRFYNLYRKIILFAPTSLFLVLLINFAIFSYFQSANSELTIRHSIQLSEGNEFKKLSNEVSQKEKMLNLSETNYARTITYYADQLGLSIVDGVKLTELEIYPLDQKSLTNNQEYVFLTGKIQVRGLCNEPENLTEWINQLNKLSWIQNISSPKYSWDVLLNKGEFEFEIEII